MDSGIGPVALNRLSRPGWDRRLVLSSNPDQAADDLGERLPVGERFAAADVGQIGGHLPGGSSDLLQSALQVADLGLAAGQAQDPKIELERAIGGVQQNDAAQPVADPKACPRGDDGQADLVAEDSQAFGSIQDVGSGTRLCAVVAVRDRNEPGRGSAVRSGVMHRDMPDGCVRKPDRNVHSSIGQCLDKEIAVVGVDDRGDNG